MKKRYNPLLPLISLIAITILFNSCRKESIIGEPEIIYDQGESGGYCTTT